MPLPRHLEIPPAWSDAAATTDDVRLLWRGLSRQQRKTGLRELWQATLPRLNPTPWGAWWDAGVPVDALFPLPAGAPTRVRQPGDQGKSCTTTALGHALRHKFAPLAHLALTRGADPNALETLNATNGSTQEPVGVKVGQQEPEYRLALVRAMLAHGWDPAPALDAPFSFLGSCVARGRIEELDEVARCRPDIDWNGPGRPGRALLALVHQVGGAESGALKDRMVAVTHWLLDRGADPLSVPAPERAPLLLKAIDWGDLGLLARLAVPGMPPSAAVRALIVKDPKPLASKAGLLPQRTSGLALLDGLTLRESLPPTARPASRPRL